MARTTRGLPSNNVRKGVAKDKRKFPSRFSHLAVMWQAPKHRHPPTTREVRRQSSIRWHDLREFCPPETIFFNVIQEICSQRSQEAVYQALDECDLDVVQAAHCQFRPTSRHGLLYKSSKSENGRSCVIFCCTFPAAYRPRALCAFTITRGSLSGNEERRLAQG